MTPEDILSHHARSFSPAARLLGHADRMRVARLYALCRTVDDLADTIGGPEIEVRLTRLAADLRGGGVSTDPLAAEAQALFAGHAVGLQAFVTLVDTVARDTGPTCIGTDAALDLYCMGVAGTVGVMVCALFDIDARWHGAAVDLGKAMQLTNICRDVAADAAVGRRYLPHTLCPHPPEVIAAGAPAVAADVRHAVGTMLARADRLYASGRTGLPGLPLRLRLTVTAAAAMYCGIGDELRARSCDPFQGRAYVPTWRKVRLVAGGVVADLRPRLASVEGRHHAAP